jgi:DNA-directed RNA polymerase subunit RPC12/RpoP
VAARAAWILKVYGLTLEQYDKILKHQGYRCAVCKKPFTDKTPHIDHEHGGHVRGIVCAYCNTRLIGRLKSPQLAQWLADYFHSPPAIEALGQKTMAPGRPRKRKPRKKAVK